MHHRVKNSSARRCALYGEFYILECTWFQTQTNCFFKIEHEIHVVNRLTAGTLQQIVYTRDDHQLVAMLFQMNQTFVGVYHLFQVNILFYNVNERVFRIVFFIHTYQLIQFHLALHHQCSEDSTREVPTIRNEINLRLEAVLQLTE